jgi:hypothetical protein
MTRFALLLAAAVSTLCCNCAFAASVPIIAVNPANGSVNEPHSNGGTWGWGFTLTAPVVATHVGWYDEGQNGLSHDHRIGLWYGDSISSVQLLGSLTPNDGLGVVIPAGTSATLDGPWRTVPLVGGRIILAPGEYKLGGTDALSSTDSVKYTNFSPDVNFAEGRGQIGAPSFSGGTVFARPGGEILIWGVATGPMLFVEPIPEPSTEMMVVLIGGSLLVASRLRSVREAR